MEAGEGGVVVDERAGLEVVDAAGGAVDGIDEAEVVAVESHKAGWSGGKEPVGGDADEGGNDEDVAHEAEADGVFPEEPEADGEHDRVVAPGVDPVGDGHGGAVVEEGGLPTDFEEEAELLFEVDEGEAAGDGRVDVVGADAAEEEVEEHEGCRDGRFGRDEAEAAGGEPGRWRCHGWGFG